MRFWIPLRPPNLSLTTRMFDGGLWLPRWQWHLGRALLSVAITLVLSWRGVHPIAAGAEALFLCGVLPHLVGAAARTFRAIDVPDWCADAWISGAGLVVAVFVADSTLGGVMAVLVYVYGYTRLYPYASP